MAFAAGVFSLVAGNPVVTGTTISSTWANNTLSDIASNGLSLCVLKDGSQTLTANLPMSGFKLTGLAAGSTSGDSVRYEQVLLLSGGTMTGNIAMGGFKLTGLAAGSANGDSVRYEQSPAAILTTTGDLLYASSANTPARVGIGTQGQALITNAGATAPVWGTPVQRSYLSGCTLSTAGSSGTMSIAAGVAVDSTNVDAMALSAISKTTSAWSVGTGNGGLDTGAIANSTWYHFYVIKRTDTGVVDVVFSTNATTPTLPANYTLYRRIGSGKTNGSAQWTLFFQQGDLFTWDVGVNDVAAAANPGTSAVTRTLTVPTGVVVSAWFSNYETNNSNNRFVLWTSLDQTDTTPSASANTFNVTSAFGFTVSGDLYVKTNTSAQVRYRTNASGASDITNVVTKGWIDRRGRDA